MAVKPNGTEAKEIGLYFLEQTGVKRMTPAIVSRTIGQVKNLLKSGYTKEEIKEVIDHNIDKGINMYSIGYISASINDALREIEEAKLKSRAGNVLEEQRKYQDEMRKAVDGGSEATKRNATKAGRFGVKSRVGEKFNFDMFEGK